MPIRLTTDCKLVDIELDQQFQKSAPKLSEEARRHLDGCPRCRELHNWISRQLPAIDLPPDFHNRIRRVLTGSLKPVTPIPSTKASALQFLLVFAVFSAVMIAMRGIGGLRSMGALQLMGIVVILATGATLFSASLAWQMAPGRYHLIPAKLAAGAFAIGFLTGVALLFPWSRHRAFVEQGWQCSVEGIAVALPAAALFWLLVRHGAPLSLRILGGTLGAMAGALAITVLQFKCTHQEALHLFVWHGGVLIGSTGAGVLIAHVVNRVRQARP